MSTTSAPLPPSPLDTWPPNWAPTAVVLDCDGLLVDTEGQWVALQDDYLARHGTAFDPATRREITGRAGEVVIAAIARAVGKEMLTVQQELLATYRHDLVEQLDPLPGALGTLRAIAAVRPVAVASNSPREMLDRKLDGLGITDVIDASVAIEDVSRPKPSPDIYLSAAQALGAEPSECLGFEDSEAGAQSALAAGLQLIAVPSIPGQEPRAPRRLGSLRDEILGDWIASWDSTR